MTLEIVFLDRDTLSPDITLRPPAFPHRWVDYPGTGADEGVAHAADADIVISNKVPLRRPDIERLPRLKMIAVLSPGIGHARMRSSLHWRASRCSKTGGWRHPFSLASPAPRRCLDSRTKRWR